VIRNALLVVLLLAACGGDPPDITGLYMTTSHEAAADSCQGGTTPADSPAYFRIEEREILGAAYRTRIDCADTEMSSCTGGSGILVEETDDGYRGDAYISSGDPAACTLIYSSYDAALSGDQLIFENYNYSESGAIDPCTTDEAEARGADMPCSSYEIIAGVRVDE
jgi:hypothetical protein